jgi:cell division protein FtsB
VWDLNQQISTQKEANATFKARNDTLDAEVRDLKQGYAAIEERARSELGMVKQDEVFYQVLQSDISVNRALSVKPSVVAPVPGAQSKQPKASSPSLKD